MKGEIVICDIIESVWTSAQKDGITFGWLILCILVSTEMGSWWWSLFTSLGFLYWIFAWDKFRTKFWKLRNKEEAIRWANGLPDDSSAIGCQRDVDRGNQRCVERCRRIHSI
jgi:hypothetical protein